MKAIVEHVGTIQPDANDSEGVAKAKELARRAAEQGHITALARLLGALIDDEHVHHASFIEVEVEGKPAIALAQMPRGSDKVLVLAVLPSPNLNVTAVGGTSETEKLVACAVPPLPMLMNVASKIGALPPAPPADYHCGDPECEACNANAEAQQQGATVH